MVTASSFSAWLRNTFSFALSPGCRAEIMLSMPVVRPVKRPDQASEELSAEISARVSSRKQDLRYCYEHWLKRNPIAAGTLAFKVRLSDEGAVVSMDVLPAPGTAAPDETAHRCFAQAFEGLSFPSGAPSELEIPLEFKPAERR